MDSLTVGTLLFLAGLVSLPVGVAVQFGIGAGVIGGAVEAIVLGILLGVDGYRQRHATNAD